MSEVQAAAAALELDEVPRHIAIIMDGNHRWAKARHLPGAAGHRAGSRNVKPLAQAAADAGVECLTLFAFSTENWERPRREIDLLMGLMRRFLESDVEELNENEVRLNVIGDTSRLAPDLQMLMKRAEQMTRENARLSLNIAVNFGGRWDIAQAARAMARDACEGLLDPDTIDEAVTSRYLSLGLGQLPAPDLCIRTGGEQRISNFLLWDLAYSELYFTDAYWPDFDAQHLTAAMRTFAERQRRFGRRA
jgi:undecaprenyl diphosphate synthase